MNIGKLLTIDRALIEEMVRFVFSHLAVAARSAHELPISQ